jgi:hypothetical protein
MKMRILLLISLLSVSGLSLGEGGSCPPGYYPQSAPGVVGCAPIPGYESNNTDTQKSSTDLPVRWADTWGAISVDGSSGSLGAVVGFSSEKEAQQAALNKCRANGGGDCNIDLTYHNQCAVMILGSKKYNTASAATVERATQLGMETCNSADTSCRVYYSGCSAAQRIQ